MKIRWSDILTGTISLPDERGFNNTGYCCTTVRSVIMKCIHTEVCSGCMAAAAYQFDSFNSNLLKGVVEKGALQWKLITDTDNDYRPDLSEVFGLVCTYLTDSETELAFCFAESWAVIQRPGTRYLQPSQGNAIPVILLLSLTSEKRISL